MSHGNVSGELTPQQKEDFKGAVATALALLIFKVNLTKAERQALPKIGNKRYAFVKEAMKIAAEHLNILPGYWDTPEWEKDFNLFDDLGELIIVVSSLLEVLIETRMAVGNDALDVAGQFKGILESANRNQPGLDEAVDRLKEFFAQTPQDDEEDAEEAPGDDPIEPTE